MKGDLKNQNTSIFIFLSVQIYNDINIDIGLMGFCHVEIICKVLRKSIKFIVFIRFSRKLIIILTLLIKIDRDLAFRSF